MRCLVRRVQRLTARERQVLALLAEGLSNDAVSVRLRVAPKTTERHISHIYEKLDLRISPDTHRRVIAAILYARWAAAGEPRRQAAA
jgi:DNA-binding CsgD family transcriptional regulator